MSGQEPSRADGAGRPDPGSPSLRRRLLGERPTWVNVFIGLGVLVILAVVLLHLSGGVGGLAMHQ